MSRRCVLRLALLPALAAAGCAHSREFRCPAEGGPPWIELESAHFRIVTDAQADVARRLAAEYEQVRQAMLAGAWEARFDPPGRLEVVVLRNPDELGEFTGAGWLWPWPVFTFVAGYFQPWERPRIVTGLAHDRDAPSLVLPPFRADIEAAAQAAESLVLRHELAHYLAFHVLVRQPRWLGEGLATYLETTVVGTYQGKPAAAVGLPPQQHPRSFGAEPVSAGKLLRGEALDYLWSGLFVHWLVNQHASQFADFQQRLARADEPLAAWKAAFPQFDPADAVAMEALDRALADYLKAGRFTVRRVMLAPVAIPGRERTLAPAEVHALRSELYVTALVDRIERARAELAESLREDPSGSAALLPLFFLRPGDELLDLGRKTAMDRPGDWRGGLLVALGASDRADLAAERLAGLRDVARAMPDDAFALNAAAWELLQLGASGEALPLAARAAALAPWSVAVLDTYGAVLADLGRCREALSAQHRAVALLGLREGAGGREDGKPGEAANPEPRRAGPGRLRDVAAEVRRHLEEIEAGCHPEQPPTPG
jgi:tetratricopeptide (TPR) repeat protein